MNYYVYVLFSTKDKGLYVGCSTCPEQRVLNHNQGSVRSTQHRRPLVLIYKEEHPSKAAAFNRERFLKSLWGARTKKRIRDKYLGLNQSGRKAT